MTEAVEIVDVGRIIRAGRRFDNPGGSYYNEPIFF
jgi:hypothetical protein